MIIVSGSRILISELQRKWRHLWPNMGIDYHSCWNCAEIYSHAMCM